jgi:hypothetical protein
MIIVRPARALPELTVTFGSPPTGAEAEAIRARQERSRRNSQWLQTHWDQLLPQAFGKFVAVVGEEAFVADTPLQAWALAQEKHPEDDSATVQYVDPRRGPKIYANRG